MLQVKVYDSRHIEQAIFIFDFFGNSIFDLSTQNYVYFLNCFDQLDEQLVI